MAYNSNQQEAPFWDFIRAFDHHGAGIDQPAQAFSSGHTYQPQRGDFPFVGGLQGAFPFAGPDFPGAPRGFGPGHCGRGGRRGRGCARPEHEGPHEGRPTSPNGEHSEGEAREGSSYGPRGPRGFGHHGGRGGRRHGPGHGPAHGHRGPPPPFGDPSGFDLSSLVESLAAHPLAQAFRAFAEQAAAQSGETLVPEDADSENSFTPPIDIFSTENNYVLHVALPGAKKEDVGINWDAERSVLNLAGVVYRQGGEEFLKSLTKSERKVGVFERTVKLPPGNNEEKEEIDGDAITAKLEDGVLVVTVPKVERDWTEIKRVDIQ